MTSAAPSVQAADYSMNDSGFWSWYFEIAAGGAIPYGHDVTVNGTPGEYEPDSGFGLAGAIGAYFQNNVRGEVAVSWFRGNDGVALGFPHTGGLNVIDVLANVYYEFPEWGGSQFTPWVGAGLGFVVFDYDNLGAGFFFNDSDVAIAGALHAGFDYAISDRVDLTGRYTLAIHGSHDVTSGANTASADSSVEHAFMGGIRVKMGGR
ncbi:MAG: outer membrane beta-barrel protein [Rhodobiaceae bacterium]|nr:outer membrane beta-barrel protein [Rhodobiaceae bacterium]